MKAPRGIAGALDAARRHPQRWRLGAAALLLAATTFTRPSVTLQRPLFSHLVVLDVTQSMNVADQQLAGKAVSRLQFAKQRLRDALLELPCGSSVGWALFTEYRTYLLFAPVEVCDNLDELRATLARIDNRMAWTGNSEVAKGLFSGIGVAAQLPGTPSLVFVTDGQEAPPINPRHRPTFNGKPGAVGGLLVGVGGLTPSPVPKTDPSGRPLGVWAADEVAQIDPYSRGRGGSVGGERMVEDGATAATVPAVPGATPGSEHLSSLREAYLRLLVSDTGLTFHRLRGAADFANALMSPALVRPVPAPVDLRGALAGLALGLLLWRPLTLAVGWAASRRRAVAGPRTGAAVKR